MRVEKITPVYLRLAYENILDKHLVTLMRNRRCSADTKIEDFRAWRNTVKIIITQRGSTFQRARTQLGQTCSIYHEMLTRA